MPLSYLYIPAILVTLLAVFNNKIKNLSDKIIRRIWFTLCLFMFIIVVNNPLILNDNSKFPNGINEIASCFLGIIAFAIIIDLFIIKTIDIKEISIGSAKMSVGDAVQIVEHQQETLDSLELKVNAQYETFKNLEVLAKAFLAKIQAENEDTHDYLDEIENLIDFYFKNQSINVQVEVYQQDENILNEIIEEYELPLFIRKTLPQKISKMESVYYEKGKGKNSEEDILIIPYKSVLGLENPMFIIILRSKEKLAQQEGYILTQLLITYEWYLLLCLQYPESFNTMI